MVLFLFSCLVQAQLFFFLLAEFLFYMLSSKYEFGNMIIDKCFSNGFLLLDTLFMCTKYSRTSLMQSRFALFPGANIRDRKYKKRPNALTLLFYQSIRSQRTLFFGTNVHYITRLFRLVNPLLRRKGRPHMRSRAAGAHHGSFPAVLACPCHMRMPACTQFPLPVPANILADHCTLHSQLSPPTLLR